MKKVFTLVFALITFGALSQTNYKDSVLEARTLKKEQLLDSQSGILTQTDLDYFRSTNYYEFNDSLLISAVWTKDIGKRFKMPTSTDRKPIYRRYGYLHFEINQKQYTLTVYQNMELRKKPTYKNYYFVPFRDETSGIETYGGGRYLDMYIYDNELNKTIDFNLSYNPYCAYSHLYSCPIPPEENTLSLPIRAGEKTPSYTE